MVTSSQPRRTERTDHDAAQVSARRVERRVGLPSGRAVIGGLLMALAAIGTFLAYAGATADDSIDVLIATRDLTSGELITADDVELVPVELPAGVRGLFGATEAAVGRQVVAPVDAGEFLLASATVMPTVGEETLEVAVALSGTRAAGRLRAGDRVDVFSTWSGEVTELIAVDARVLEVRGGESALGGGDTVVVRLAVADFAQVEALVHAQAAGDLTMIRATIGTALEDVGREYRPLTTGAERSAASKTDAGTEPDTDR